MNKALRWLMGICTVIYIPVLVMLLFGGSRGLWAHWAWEDYLAANTNLRPFFTIGNYLRAFLRGSINADIVIKNLLGNLVMFVPMGFVLPCYKPMLRRLWLFLPG